ncbi:MAG TPA: outer membrane beta-barrel family protein [Chitinophagaceae bacterium]|nr:outer membrane beta-barrel family protein [Chitinophagaceae bacterium]
MKKFFATVFCFMTMSVLLAQMPGGRGLGGQSMNVGHFYGKIIDSTTNRPLESVSVQLIQNKLDTVTKKRKDAVIAGMLTGKNGDFSLENLPVMASFKLLITGIGYKTFERKVSFTIKMGGDMSQMMNAVDKDLGNIKLQTDAKQLAEVVVTGTSGMLQMGIDRKIFNVDKNLVSVGGTAVDVMKSVPSVNVDIDGNVTLRNASPQIFVDGRPSTLTLDQIPADAIQSVEIITNPSAKFDASGGGSGILNIVLKKARKAGYSGNVRANISSYGRIGVGGDFNAKQGKLNFFANTMFNQMKSLSTVQTTRTDFLANNNKAYLSQNSAPENEGTFGFFRGGLDFFADIRNTFTIAGTYVRGKFNSEDMINIQRDTNFVNYTSKETGLRSSDGSFSFRNYGTTFSYKHNFAKSGKEVTADVNYNNSKNDNNGLYKTQYFLSNNSPKGPMQQEHIFGGGNTKFFTVQTDFVNPITEKMKFEMGARGALRNYSSFSISVPGLSNNYKFKDEVYAGYLTFSQSIKNFTYQLGARVENSKYTGTQIDKNLTFKNEYPFSFFPSVFLTQKINDKQSVQLNYSRKINRPNFFQLIPYVDFSDSLNLSIGNPALIPEFTNLVEFSYNVDLTKGNSFLGSVYYRNTNDLITRYQYRDKNPNPVKTDSVIFSTFANANNSFAYGLELTGKIRPAKIWDITANVNLYNSKINGNNIQSNLQQEQVSWFGKINNSFKLPKNYSIQFTANYQSKTILPSSGGGQRGGGHGGGGMMFGGGQLSTANGFIKPNYGFDIAFRKDFMKNNAASLTLSISDIFKTREYNTHSESIYFVQDNIRSRDPQVARLNFNWRFGKFDVSLFKRKNLKGEQEGMQNGMQGIQQ